MLARVKTQLENRDLIERLDNLSSYDQLTNIFNRRKFFELANPYLENHPDDNIIVVMVDIDKFKAVNDTYGHHAGDIVLKTVVNLIEQTLPPESIFGRLGGEEFAIVFQGLSDDDALAVIENCRQKIENTSIAVSDDIDIHVTISSGVVKKTAEYEHLDAALMAADELLYEAKEDGRNQFKFRFRSRP